MSTTDDEFNREATPLLAQPDGDGGYTHPGIMVGGALVLVYVENGRLVISADFDTVTSPPFELYGNQQCTPVEVRMSGETVWQADASHVYTPEQLEKAYARAVGVTIGLMAEDDALDYLDLAEGVPPANGPFTREQAMGYWSHLAEQAKESYNPDGEEDNVTVRSDRCGDLVVNLAGGYLADPEAVREAVIAEAWKDLSVPGECASCGADVEKSGEGFWEAPGDTADARRHCGASADHLHHYEVRPEEIVHTVHGWVL